MTSPVIQFKRGAYANLPALQAGEPALTTDTFEFYVGIDSTTTNNKFFGSHRYWKREGASTGSGVNLVEGSSNGSNFITLKSPDNLSGITTYTFPETPTADYFLKTNASGDLSWAAVVLNSFAGIVTFTDTTDNTLGNENTGAIQIDGGVGIAKNLTVKQNLHVGGYSEFVGVATFKGGTINLGDSTGDDINVGGEFISGLFPNTTATYDLGDGSRQWRHGNFSGIVTASTGAVFDGVQIGINGGNVIDTVSGNLTLNSAGGQTIIDDLVTIQNNLTVNGNVTVGGTTVTLRGTDVYIENKDIILGYTTSVTPNDDTANHAGVAIASTVGSPLANFDASGINTLSSTYKQMMWFKSGTLGFSTDAFAFNYGVAIGTTQMANGLRLKVGSGITMTDTEISATTFRGAFTGNVTGNASSADQVKTVTASDLNSTHYLTFVNSHNGSATNESIYTDDGIYYNPGTNTFTTQHALFTGDVTVNGTLTGTATTATRATTVDTTATSTNATYYVPFVDTLGGENGETLRVGVGLSINPSTGAVGVSSVLSVGTGSNSYIKAGGGSNAMFIYSNGNVAFQGTIGASQINDAAGNKVVGLAGSDASFVNNVSIAGIATVGTGVGITQFSGSVSTGTSTSSVPTSSAVINYVGTQISNIDLTTSTAGDTGTGSVSTSQTLTIAGTAGEVETSASGQTITVGLPDTVIVGTALSVPTVKTATVQHSNGTQAATIDTSGNITASQNLTVSGNLYVNGSTTQVNTAAMTVEDRTIELGVVDGSAPSSTTTWDLGVLFNYYDGSAKKSALVWEQADARFKLGSVISDGGGTGTSNPQITFTTYAPLEIGALWVNDCAGQSQVISCSGSTRKLENITIDGGTW
jgi:hypothetical protein